ncbi:Longin [Pleurostoma richardsiae]|uniref:Longin n=1 Tax=Pleurostoma richardsiae TaxID=41990 RepID=A0AA38RQP2_9PEZI|nr:Longin [Pleurostoma richardsiae]
MATTIPSIACLGVIGRNNNPLHITIFPSHDPSTGTATAPLRTPLQFSLLLSATLDVFELRASRRSGGASAAGGGGGVGLGGDQAGSSSSLLHAVDERLAAYGSETNTGVRFVAVVDVRGRSVAGSVVAGGGGVGGLGDRKGMAAVGLREADMKPVFKAMQTAYIKLLQNPFYDPDEHAPLGGRGGKKITSRKFAEDMRRIGETWTPGMTSL